MGWDYVAYGDRYAHLHDLQLWALRHFLAGAAGALAAEEPHPLRSCKRGSSSRRGTGRVQES